MSIIDKIQEMNPFQKKDSVGVYIGKEGVGFSRISAAKEVFSTYISFVSIEEEINAENLEEDVKLEAIIGKGLREIKAESKEVSLGLFEEDVIFRSFDVPLMSRTEAELSIPIEAEKYIPFKIDDLDWDFAFAKKGRQKTMDVGFVGVKRDVVERYKKVFDNVGIRIKNIHPVGFGMLRLLKAEAKLETAPADGVAVISFWSTEADVLIFNKKLFPSFGRCSRVPIKATTKELDMLKFLDEIRLTFDYYRREVGSDISKIYVITDEKLKDYFQTFDKDTGIPTEVYTPFTLISRTSIQDLESLKACAIASRGLGTVPFEVNIIKETKKSKLSSFMAKASATDLSQMDLSKVFKMPKMDVIEVPLNFKVIISFIVMGAAAAASMFLYTGKELTDKSIELRDFKKKNPIPREFEDVSLDAIGKKIAVYNRAIEDIEAKKKVYFSPMGGYFADLESLLTSGLWIENITYDYDEKTKRPKIVLLGYVFLDDEQKESISLNEFIDNITSSSTYKGMDTKLLYMQRDTLDGFLLTKFSIEIA